MSGIAGCFGTTIADEIVFQMLEKMNHRGPDGYHIMKGKGFTVGCCQLEAGPKRTSACIGNTEAALVFDGLVFNEKDTHTPDTEVLWKLYQNGKRSCFKDIDGAFALAIAREEELLLARDHVGANPLFYGMHNDTIYFSSECKSLTGVVRDVEELPAGKIFSSQTGTENFPMFVPEVPTFNTPEEAREILRDLLIKATADRMSDGAVKGSALSGGLDSSIIAVIANQIDPTIPFFTVGIEGSLDIKNAQLMADYLDARDRIHIHIISEKEIEKAVPDAIWYLESFEEDCISGCIANFFASHLASQHTKCTLSGEGADELFGGYHLLKEIENGKERKAMMDKLVNIAYNTALRRLDRGWLSCSVNYRTPFLDSRVIALSQQIPVEWKIHGPTQVEKWILREAFRDMLPPEIADRRKLRFSAGTRVDDIMDTIASKHISQEEYEAHRTTKSGYQLNSPKELWYYKIFKDLFPDDTFEKQVDRWDPFK